jgi:hypothetical protein
MADSDTIFSAPPPPAEWYGQTNISDALTVTDQTDAKGKALRVPEKLMPVLVKDFGHYDAFFSMVNSYYTASPVVKRAIETSDPAIKKLGVQGRRMPLTRASFDKSEFETSDYGVAHVHSLNALADMIADPAKMLNDRLKKNVAEKISSEALGYFRGIALDRADGDGFTVMLSELLTDADYKTVVTSNTAAGVQEAIKKAKQKMGVSHIPTHVLFAHDLQYAADQETKTNTTYGADGTTVTGSVRTSDPRFPNGLSDISTGLEWGTSTNLPGLAGAAGSPLALVMRAESYEVAVRQALEIYLSRDATVFDDDGTGISLAQEKSFGVFVDFRAGGGTADVDYFHWIVSKA